ncbi:MAG: DNA adenine methylase [Campylobacteraceae bacterium]|jgi:adenine-specific DNA-methyltransferase|nr:DNA adenine methylase [Campylobacteraceae bacterium]
MNYIGSKLKLSPWIKKEITAIVGSLEDKVFCDLFAGTGTIGKAFKKYVKKVISNDIEEYSYVLNRNYIQNHKAIENSDKFIAALNTLKPLEDGFIYKHYCIGGDNGRQYFSDENGKKIDAVRAKINEWRESGEIDDDLYYFLLSSLLESADKVANTASIYGAFLKKMKKSAKKPLKILASDFELNNNCHEVYKTDSNVLIKKISGDILYLDPPYNIRQYGANYHILNTIAKYDDFIPFGKTGIRKYVRSDYCKKKRALKSFEELIKDANFKHIFLSYNNEGLMSLKQIKAVMEKYGQYCLKTKEHRRYISNKNGERKTASTLEYLHVLEKRL